MPMQHEAAAHEFWRLPRRTKADWAGVRIADAFNPNLDYYESRPARQLFYRQVRAGQRLVVECLGETHEVEPKGKAQIGPFYADYPRALAAHASLGLTIYLELDAHLEHSLLARPTSIDPGGRDDKAYEALAQLVATTVEQRLQLATLDRRAVAPSVEIYRLFLAAQQELRFASLAEIVRVVVLLGDIIPAVDQLDCHPVSAEVICRLADVSRQFERELEQTETTGLVTLGSRWVRALCDCLRELLARQGASAHDQVGANLAEDTQPGAGDATAPAGRIAPLDRPPPPSVNDAPTPQPSGTRRSKAAGANPQPLDAFAAAVEQAAGPGHPWEDRRSDQLSRQMAAAPFSDGPIVGSPTEGHEIEVSTEDGRSFTGHIFDRVLELSDDSMACDELRRAAAPFETALRKQLYPSLQAVPEKTRLLTSGALDPKRLALAGVASTVFHRYVSRRRPDRRGQPVVMLACDGSSSLNTQQVSLLKVLAAGWLGATARSGIKVLAGLYHSGRTRSGASGPLVQWIYHPTKTPSFGRADAVRAVASLPPRGYGAQSDALSLAFLLDEAFAVARGSTVYLIVLTDTAWNISFRQGQSGFQEVSSLLERLGEEHGSRLHTTLVGLGVSGKPELDGVFDDVLRLPKDELKNYAKTAERVGLFVASRMRERRRVLAG